MCPDRQLLSIHIDGELPSPWKEKLETHLAACGSCREALDRYRKVSADLEPVSPDSIEDARARVWASLARPTVVERAPSRWRRALVIPLPAAAAVLVVALLAAGTAGMAARSGKTESMAVIRQTRAPAVPVADMGSVLRYLESQDSAGEILIIRLPESSNFSYAGEPALIRAADYNGRLLP